MVPKIVQVSQQLAAELGAEACDVRSPYHVKLRVSGQCHELYINKHGQLKLSIRGQKTKQFASIDKVVDAIRAYDAAANEVALARKAVDLAALTIDAQRQLPIDVAAAVFTDAGWKDGIGQVAFVFVRRVQHGIATTADSSPVPCDSPLAAELLAIEYAADFAPKAVIYSDCQPLVSQLAEKYGGRLRWLPRSRNKAADKIGNRRT